MCTAHPSTYPRGPAQASTSVRALLTANPTTTCPHLPACRLKALPAGVQSTIARTAGRPARRACRLLSDAYGPLDGGLRMDGVDDAQELLGMVALSPHRFDCVTSLVLVARPTTVCPAGCIPALCTALPKLSSMYSVIRIHGADVAALAPLVPHLTSLVLAAHAHMGAGLGSLVPRLTWLRSLALPLASWCHNQTVQHELQVLSSLRHLQALEWLGGEGSVASAALWLPPLRALSGLTSLLIRPALHSWDEAAVDALRMGFPELVAVALKLDLEEAEGLRQAAVAALAAHTTLTTVQLDTRHVAQVVDLGCLSALHQLGKLAVTADHDGATDQILEAARHATGLTSLQLQPYYPSAEAASTHFPALAANLKDLRLAAADLRGHMFPVHMCALYGVTKLALESVVLDPTDPQEPLGLGNLEVLELCLTSCVRGGAVLQALQLARLSGLRDLTLDGDALPDDRPWTGDSGVVLGDVHLWQLLPLSSTLARLVLGGTGGCFGALNNIQGPGLAVVGRLTCLQHLALRGMAVLGSPCMHESLLPLPASLRRLELQTDAVAPGVLACLQAAARGQDCVVRVGSWV
jgi:hypothetical protein